VDGRPWKRQESGRPRRGRAANGVSVGAALIALGALAAACGGSPTPPGVASLGSTSTTTTTPGGSSLSGGLPNLHAAYQEQLAFSQCMRTHGEPSYPDPVLSAHGLTISNVNADPNSRTFIAATAACKKLVPNGGPPTQAQMEKAVASALKHSECMRAHGVPNFPDPQVSGGGIRIAIGGAGLDPNSPQFQAAQKVCLKAAPLSTPG